MKHAHNHESVKSIRTAFFLNLFFAMVEFAGGLLTNSVAIMSDALHDMGDSLSLGLAWILEGISGKKRTNMFSYGYKRMSLLGALANSAVLLGGSVFIIGKAVQRISSPQMPDTNGMILLAVFGIAVNGFAAWKTSRGKTLNEKVVFLHLLEDVLGWIAVLIISVVMIFTSWSVLDPLLSIGISAYILLRVAKNLRETARLFLQASPRGLDTETIGAALQKVKGVVSVHDIHSWSLDGQQNIVSAHITISDHMTISQTGKLKRNLKKVLKKIGVTHSTLEFETQKETCRENCDAA